MNPTAVTVAGTVKPDGALELDEKLALPPGRVRVTVETVPAASPAEDFWTSLERFWVERKAQGLQPRSAEEIDADLHQLDEEWEERDRYIEGLHEDYYRRQATSPDRPGPAE